MCGLDSGTRWFCGWVRVDRGSGWIEVLTTQCEYCEGALLLALFAALACRECTYKCSARMCAKSADRRSADQKWLRGVAAEDGEKTGVHHLLPNLLVDGGCAFVSLWPRVVIRRCALPVSHFFYRVWRCHRMKRCFSRCEQMRTHTHRFEFIAASALNRFAFSRKAPRRKLAPWSISCWDGLSSWRRSPYRRFLS